MNLKKKAVFILLLSQASFDSFSKQGLASYCVPNQGIGNESTNNLTLLPFLFIQSHVQNLSPLGSWKTIDDVTGREKSIVKIWEENSKLYGKIKKLFRLPAEDPDPICDKCKGKNKDKQVLGMTILWDLSYKKDVWKGEKILDPDNVKIYGCKIRFIDNRR